MKQELMRVGLFDCPAFSFVYTSPDPWETKLAEAYPSCVGGHACAVKFLNLALSQARTMREALSMGYGRVLFLEDDIRFLKSESETTRALRLIPSGFGIVQFDKFVDYGKVTHEEYGRICEAQSVNSHYFDELDGEYYSGGCFSMDADAMEAFLSHMERVRPAPCDLLMQTLPVRRAAAKKNVAVQVTFEGAMVREYARNATDGSKSHHAAYSAQGVRYEDYAVPEGYGYERLTARA
jgi:hypothetical protein